MIKTSNYVEYKSIKYTNDIPYLNRLYEKEAINFSKLYKYTK